MWIAGVDEAQAVIKIAWRNVNNLSYVGDTLMAESEKKNQTNKQKKNKKTPEEPLMKVKEETTRHSEN